MLARGLEILVKIFIKKPFKLYKCPDKCVCNTNTLFKPTHFADHLICFICSFILTQPGILTYTLNLLIVGVPLYRIELNNRTVTKVKV